ncbi:MAG: 2,3,4,5-tetrahydropyridine-2,6-dicarboxylate N-succinyltransferase [Ignavibacteriales bacterium]|nr:2,3,4,5-tetrahydropyridine-2,6-dicarboxylate N-succinyltransferase [Ignavibacteriales bacterium]
MEEKPFTPLQEKIEELYLRETNSVHRKTVLPVFSELRRHLNSGEIRAAEFREGRWYVNDWVKKGILLGFRYGVLSEIIQNESVRFFDKDNFPLKKITLEDGIREVPGGTSIRDGCYIANGVVIMPPAYINIGAFVDEGTMIDSHALVGSCAQIGKNVHISAGAQVGGVLEPVGSLPVIIEDDVILGGNSGVFEGVIIRKGAVIASGVCLTSSTPIYDTINEKVYKKGISRPLIVPENAVVVSGSRKLIGEWSQKNGLQIYTPVIIKYRDAKTDSATTLEDTLRS